ncbi:MAG: hypothetical protein AAGE01_22070, partial [Pseudomonadota bacterium]
MPDRRGFLAAVGAAGSLAATRALALDALDAAALSDLEKLEAELTGRLLLPSSAEYDRARRVFSFNPRTDRRPALIVQAAGDADVARAIAFARSHGLPLAVRAGGHDVLG